MKKVLSGILAFTMAATLLVGCGTSDDSSKETGDSTSKVIDSTKKVTLTV